MGLVQHVKMIIYIILYVHTEGTPVVLYIYVHIERDICSGAVYIHARRDIGGPMYQMVYTLHVRYLWCTIEPIHS